jgi:hypothetical protein
VTWLAPEDILLKEQLLRYTTAFAFSLKVSLLKSVLVHTVVPAWWQSVLGLLPVVVSRVPFWSPFL